MQFLRALFWLVLGIAVAVFTVGNWRNVTLDIWGGLQADVKIPVLVLGAFLLGFLPMWLTHRFRLWRDGRTRATEVHEVGGPYPAPEPVPAPMAPPLPAPAPEPAHESDSPRGATAVTVGPPLADRA